MKPGMKKFLLRILIFLLPVIVFLGWLEIKARQLPNTYAIKKQAAEKQLDSIHILVFGSSHAFDDIDPEWFSYCGFNFANSSQSLFHDSQLCLKYCDRMPRLKTVVFTISYFSLWFEMQDLPESWRDYFYLHYWGIRHPSLNPMDIKYWSYAALYTRPFLKDMIFNAINKEEEFGYVRPNGWKKVENTNDSNEISDKSGEERVKFHNSIIHGEHLSENTRYLEQVLEKLNTHNIQVVFVIPPVFKSYSKFADPTIMAENRRIISGLCKKYNARFFDYFSDPRFLKEDFMNNDHLNWKGAKKFSLILDSDFVAKVCR
jgi:hypothetical protein